MKQTTLFVVALFGAAVIQVNTAYALKVERMAYYSPSSQSAQQFKEVVSGQVLVKFAADISSTAKHDMLVPKGFEIFRELPLIGLTLVKLPAGMSVSAGISIISSLTGVEAVVPNNVYRAKRVPNDASLVLQYGLNKLDAFRAWEYDTGASTAVTVAVIDTGMDGSHPDLSAKLAGASQFFDPNNGGLRTANNPPTPACNHATRVAGVAAASTDNGIGVAGVSWGARLISMKIFADSDCYPNCADEAGAYSCSSDDVTISEAINYAVSLHGSPSIGKVVINMSIGNIGGCSLPVQTAVDNATAAGVIVVAAAGNGASVMDSPANCNGVIAAGATDIADNRASFSAIDNLMMSKGVSAPGVDIYTTDAGGGYAYADGTSFASPFVSGLAALVWSVKPYFTAAQVWTVIKGSVDDIGDTGPDKYFGFGRINAYKAVLLALNGNISAGVFPGKAYAYPNPFNVNTSRLLLFSVPRKLLEGEDFELEIFTMEGEMVRKLSGLSWDGKNEEGQKVASGVYMFLVSSSKGTAKGKFALIR